MSVENTRLEEWLARKMQDPEFRKAYEELEPAYQLARLRIEQGLTQQQVADLVGTKQPNIARLESGKHAPTLDLLEQVAKALGARVKITIEPLENAESGGRR